MQELVNVLLAVLDPKRLDHKPLNVNHVNLENSRLMMDDVSIVPVEPTQRTREQPNVTLVDVDEKPIPLVPPV